MNAVCHVPAHQLARSVHDLYMGLSILNGPDWLDPFAVPAPPPVVADRGGAPGLIAGT